MARIVNALPAGPTDAGAIAAFEKQVGHPLPAAYREFLLAHNGGHPEPDAFDLPEELGGDENVVHCFFPLRDHALQFPAFKGPDGLRVWPVQAAWDDIRNDYGDQIDPPLLPVGTDG